MKRFVGLTIVLLAGVATAGSELVWVAPSLPEYPPIPSFTTEGFSDQDPFSANVGKTRPSRLRITDARVDAVSATHVVLVSSETDDVLLLPLKKAALEFQVRGRAGSALAEAIALKGDSPDDEFSANAWLIEDGASRIARSKMPRAVQKAEGDKQSSAAAPGLTAAGSHEGLGSAAKAHQDAIIQSQRFAYDSQKQASRLHEDAMRNHNRMLEDAQSGFDPARNLVRFGADSQVDASRQMHDAQLQGIRSMNDAAGRSGMAPTVPEPTFYNPAFP